MKRGICFTLLIAVLCGGAFGMTAFERRDKAKADIEKIDAKLAVLRQDGMRAKLTFVEFIDYLYGEYFDGEIYKEKAYKLTPEEKMVAIYRKKLQMRKSVLKSRIAAIEQQIARRDHRVLNEKDKKPVVPFRTGKGVDKNGTSVVSGNPPILPSQLRKAEARKKMIQKRKAKREKKSADTEK